MTFNGRLTWNHDDAEVGVTAAAYWRALAEKAEHVAKERAATIKEQAALIDALRAEQPRPLTAREHLDAAWEAAHVPEGETIPKGAWAIQREPGGQILTAYAEHDHVRARDPFAPQMERRLLDPPAPPRPEGAEKVEAVLHQYWSGDINGDDLADRIVEEMNR